jgi:ergothioneine biosynthesis protein EgtB
MQPAHSLKTENLIDAYLRVRQHTETLCEPLEIEDYIPQPIVDVSPVFDESFGFLFNSYYNSIGDRTARDNRGDLSRPTVKHVFEYRKHVDRAMRELLSVRDSTHPADTPYLTELVVLGLNHEQQHQELFIADLKYTFSVNPLFPVYREGYAPEEMSEPPASVGGQFVDIAAGIYEIGFNGDGFHFDNELGRHKVYLDDFSISNRLVTNGEFLEFVNDGGYKDHRLWHSEGWDWVNRENITAPLYWLHRDGEWHHFTLGGLRQLPMDAPVCHISLYEASAFAEWKGMRLPTEFEWEAANARFEWGLRWEWTNSAYLPYPGFAKPDGAVGEYNGKFMMNQMVLRGASVATAKGHSRPTYRNFFHPHLRWQFTGLRLAK